MTLKLENIYLPLLMVAVLACGGEDPAAGPVAETQPAPPVEAYEPAAMVDLGQASAVGDAMPAYSAKELGGGTWRLADENGVTMLNLWATWCGPCRYEIPALIDLQKDYGDKGLQVVGVSMDQAGMEPQIDSFARNAGINYKIVHDPRAQLADVFDTTIIPTTALIDGNGKIVWYHAGIVTRDDPKMLQALEAALAAQTSAASPSQS